MGKASKWLRSLFTRKKKNDDGNTAAALVSVSVAEEKMMSIHRVITAAREDGALAFNEDAAAVKIQTSFRSYLARKALRALKGLVTLQALVRGHLVRKRAAAALHSMEMLIAAQSRARGRRIQMLEEARQHDGRRSSPSHKDTVEDNVEIAKTDHGETLLSSTTGELEDLSSSCKHGTSKSSSSVISYMAATESSRAKARSWRPDGVERRRSSMEGGGGRRPRELVRVRLNRSNASSTGFADTN